MKKNALVIAIFSLLSFSIGFLANHLMNRVLNTACVDIESYNKMQNFNEDEEIRKMHEDFKLQKEMNKEAGEASKIEASPVI